MKLTKCANKHFYDADQFDRCPHCDKAGLAPLPPFQVGPMRHVRTEEPVLAPPNIFPINKSNIPPTSSIKDYDESPKTERVLDGFVVGVNPENSCVNETGNNSASLLCGNCGVAFRGGGTFCIMCGAKIMQTTTDAMPEMQSSSNTPKAIPDAAPPETQPSPGDAAAVADASQLNAKPTAPQNSLQSQISAISSHKQGEDVKTMALYNFSDVEPVVGWLVSVKGEYIGQGFNLKAGQNFIGRSLTMDVPLAKDTSVSRNKHAVITFDPINRNFFVQPGDSNGLTYLNSELVLAHQPIKAYDNLKLGSSEFIFVPFCGQLFSWDEIVE